MKIKTNTLFTPVLLSVIILFAGCETTNDYADLVLLNGNIITMDLELNQFSALAIKSDTIFSAGSDETIRMLIGEKTEIIELNGETVLPGFIESHAHFLGLGKALMNLDLSDAVNWNGIIAEVVIKAEQTNPGEWIIGRGWHQEKWDPRPNPNIEGYPLHDMLSEAVPYHPVMLTHASGHAILANAKAMRLAGITDSTSDPEGGRIIRDAAGKATGVFEETAEELIYKKYLESLDTKSPEDLNETTIQQVELATAECLKNGITSFHDAGATFGTIDFYKSLADSGRLDLRLYVMVGDNLNNLKIKLPDYRMVGYGNNFLTVKSIKMYIDGALGSRGAWMLEPYDDLPGHSGLNVTPFSELNNVAQLALDNGYQLCTHAIGDRGNREMLNIYENLFGSPPAGNNLRWRIEHAQHLSANDIIRFSKLGVIAAMQGVHCTSDAPFVVDRLGIRRAQEGAYVWRKLLDNGAVICNGTDAPVENVSPIKSYYSTVTRTLKDGSRFFPDQKMTRIEALKSYTINGAYAAFEETIKGTLEPGKLADITILSRDLLTIPEEEILSTEVLMTIVGGKVKYKK